MSHLITAQSAAVAVRVCPKPAARSGAVRCLVRGSGGSFGATGHRGYGELFGSF